MSEERYLNDPAYNKLVDSLVNLMQNNIFTPVEILQATLLAFNHFDEKSCFLNLSLCQNRMPPRIYDCEICKKNPLDDPTQPYTRKRDFIAQGVDEKIYHRQYIICQDCCNDILNSLYSSGTIFITDVEKIVEIEKRMQDSHE